MSSIELQKKPMFFWEKIAFRIAIGFLFPIFVCAYAVLSASSTYSDLAESKDKINQHWNSVHLLNGKAMLSLTKLRMDMLSLVVDSTSVAPSIPQNDLRDFSSFLGQSRKVLDLISQENSLPEDVRLLRFYSVISDQEHRIGLDVERWNDAFRRKNFAEMKNFKREIDQLATDMETGLARLGSGQEIFAGKLADKVAEHEQSTANTIHALLLIVFMICVAASIGVTYSIVGPTRQVLLRFRGIANGSGDLHKRVQTRAGGEMGELAYWMNVFLGKTQGIIETIANASEVIRKTTDSASGQTAKTNLLAAAINKSMTEQSMDLDDCTVSLSSIDDLIQASSDSTRQAASLSKIAMDRALQGGASVHETVEAMMKIEDSAKKIEILVSSINEIASQTNLLAINAAIEATKAGEHGKGFGVVAEEVRKLAERARRLTGEVNVLIGESGTRVKAGVSLAKAAGISLDGIIKDVEAVVSLIQRIATSSTKQTESSANLLDGMRKVSEAVRVNLTDMQQVTRATEVTALDMSKLEALVGQLNEVVFQFRHSSQQERQEQVEETPPPMVRAPIDSAEITSVMQVQEPKTSRRPALPTLLPTADIQNDFEDEGEAKKDIA